MSPTLVYMLFCYFVTLFFRKAMELKWPSLKVSEGWKDFLPTFPVIAGVLFAYIPKYPIPAVFIGSWTSKGIWGFVAGALSTWAYAILQAVFKRMFGFDISTFKRSVPPAAVAGAPALPPMPPPAPTGANLTALDASAPAVAADAEKK
jgi:hypothetical protein